MALIICPSCGHKISDKAAHCPKCGCIMTSQTVSDPKDSEATVDNKTADVDFSSQSLVKQKNNRLKIILIVIAVVVFSALGALYGIHRHKTKVLAEQEAAIQQKLEEEEQARQKAIEDSIARVNFQTPDLKLLGLHGPVKSVVYDRGTDPVLDMEFVSIDEEGLINKMSRYGQDIPDEKAVLKRDSKELIEEWSYYPDYFSELEYENYGRVRRHFSYGAENFVNKIQVEGMENSYEETPTWDETGQLSKTTIKGAGEGVEYKIVTTYKYLKTDKYDNWTEVEVTNVYSDGYDSNKEKKIITRTIAYYE